MNKHHLENVIKSGNLSKLYDYLLSCGFSSFEIEQIQAQMKAERSRSEKPIANFLLDCLLDKDKVFKTLLFMTRPAGSIIGNPPFAFMQRTVLFITGINFNPQTCKNINEIWWTPISDADMLLFSQYTKKYAKRIAEGKALPALGFTKMEEIPLNYVSPIPSMLIN